MDWWDELKENYIFQIIVGLILFILGLILTIGTIKDGEKGFTIWYGAILVGIGMFIRGILKVGE